MASVVPFNALELMPYVFAALGSGNAYFIEVPRMDNAKKFEIHFDAKAGDGNGGNKSLVVLGEFDVDSNTAFQGALVASLVTIREGFNLYVGDYSYTKMVSKHMLFASVQEKLKGMTHCFYELATAVRAFLATCLGIIKDLSTHSSKLPWIDGNCSALSLTVRHLTQQLKRSKCAIELSAQHANIASDPVSFFEDVEPPMEFNAEASFFLIRAIFDKVMTVVNGSVPHVSTAQMTDGFFQSHFFFDLGGFAFHGDRCNSSHAAKSSVMLKGLRHVDDDLMVEIRDLTFDMWRAMRQTIDCFDAQMGFLTGHADSVKQAVMTCYDTFGDQISMLQSVASSLRADERCADGLNKAVSSLRSIKESVEAAYGGFCASKTTLAELQANQV